MFDFVSRLYLRKCALEFYFQSAKGCEASIEGVQRCVFVRIAEKNVKMTDLSQFINKIKT